jgi:DNA replication protein DnaC
MVVEKTKERSVSVNRAMETIFGDEYREYLQSPHYDEEKFRELKRSQERCANCLGLEHCKSRGYFDSLELTAEKRGYIVTNKCPLRRAADFEKSVESLLAGSMIPLNLQACSLENFIVDFDGADGKLREALALAWRAVSSNNSVVFSGNPGVGKTHLAVGVAKAKIKAGKRAVFISVIDYLSRLKNSFSMPGNGGASYSRMMDLLGKEAYCLVLDDLGIEKPTAWVVERLYDIINTRLSWNLQTVITTNFADIQELSEHMNESPAAGERIVSRLLSFGWVNIQSGDYRQRNWSESGEENPNGNEK